MFLLFLTLLLILLFVTFYVFLRDAKVKKEKGEDGFKKMVEGSMLNKFYLLILYVLLISIFGAGISNIKRTEVNLIKNLDELQAAFENVLVYDEISDIDWISKLQEYNEDVAKYNKYVAARENKELSIYFDFAGPLNPIVFKDAEKEYKSYSISDLHFSIIES